MLLFKAICLNFCAACLIYKKSINANKKKYFTTSEVHFGIHNIRCCLNAMNIKCKVKINCKFFFD